MIGIPGLTPLQVSRRDGMTDEDIIGLEESPRPERLWDRAERRAERRTRDYRIRG